MEKIVFRLEFDPSKSEDYYHFHDDDILPPPLPLLRYKDLLEEHIFIRKKAFLNRDMNANEKYVKFLFENTPQPLHDNLSQIEFDFIRDVITNM